MKYRKFIGYAGGYPDYKDDDNLDIDSLQVCRTIKEAKKTISPLERIGKWERVSCNLRNPIVVKIYAEADIEE